MPKTLVGACNNGNGSSTSTASQTLYCGLGSALLSFNVGTESQTQTKIVDAGTFNQFAAIVQTNGRSTATGLQFRVGAVNGSESVSVGGGLTGTFADSVDSDTTSAGALCDYAQTTGLGAGSFLCNSIAQAFNGGFGAPMNATAFNGNTGYFRGVSFWHPSSDLNTSGGQGSSTENSGMATRVRACTLSNLYTIWPNNGMNGTATVRSRVALANGNSNLSIGAGATGTFTDTVDTDAIPDLSLLDWNVTSVATTGVASPVYVFGAWLEYASGGHQNFSVGQQTTISTGGAGTNNFVPLIGTPVLSATEVNTQTVVGFPAGWSNLRIIVGVPPSATATYTSRVNGAPGLQSVSILTSSSGTYEDTVDADNLPTGSLICANINTGSSSGLGYFVATSQFTPNVVASRATSASIARAVGAGVSSVAPRVTTGSAARPLPNGLSPNISVVAPRVAAKGIARLFPAGPNLCPTPVNPQTTIQKILPSYLYQQYTDDDDLQAFVAAYNKLAQEYLDWHNNANLPFYPGLSGALLDWVAQGLYGLTRPLLPFGLFRAFGTYNSSPYNTFYYNQFNPSAPVAGRGGYAAANDDIFQRILTWHFFKGDGKYFTVRWLKRRIQRFIAGPNGLQQACPPLAETYRISVRISNDVVYINFTHFNAFFKSGARYNDKTFVYNKLAYNESHVATIVLPAIPLASTFKAAVDAGALELPFQFTYVVSI